MTKKISTIALFQLANLIFCNNNAIAGGDDYSIVIVTAFSELSGVYTIGVQGRHDNQQVFGGCRQLDIKVKYQYVPWYSWLPFIQTTHPSKEDNEEALDFVHKSFIDRREIYFTVAGNGLIETKTKCVFESKGLRQFGQFVFSYYHPF
ncbi:hypothetical protein [Methylomonas koyamae]|uniref:hypothetical protein n=1 Tax=Methylomonas koyamae TaxID=702114 RepID=UPI0012F69E41|nr:hypothetical protein [Methylomonas koyamae]